MFTDNLIVDAALAAIAVNTFIVSVFMVRRATTNDTVKVHNLDPVRVGDTESSVLIKLGKPSDRTVSTEESGVRESWTYKNMNGQRLLVYFTNGVVDYTLSWGGF